MKITIWQKFIGWLIIKPLLREESIELLKGLAKGLPDDQMTKRWRVIQHFAKEILKQQ